MPTARPTPSPTGIATGPPTVVAIMAAAVSVHGDRQVDLGDAG